MITAITNKLRAAAWATQPKLNIISGADISLTEFTPQAEVRSALTQLKFSNARIVLVLGYPAFTRLMLCAALRENMVGKYQYMLLGGMYVRTQLECHIERSEMMHVPLCDVRMCS